jgi:hypothetical protein
MIPQGKDSSMKCKCAMCGRDEAGRVGRASYAKAGVYTYEERAKGERKRRERRIRRRREKAAIEF